MHTHNYFLCCFLLFAALFAITSLPQKPAITFMTSSGNHTIFFEKATTQEQQAQGLMHRTTLQNDQGMLFIFTEQKPHTFWMKNTKIPLDIIFIDTDKRVVDIKQNFQPCTQEPCERYTSKPAQYALEVNAGIAQNKSIIISTQIIFP